MEATRAVVYDFYESSAGEHFRTFLDEWLLLTRQKITAGTAMTTALDYSLKLWSTLTRFVNDERVPVNNN